MSTYYQYFETLAKQHKDIRHEQPRSVADNTPRKAFFLNNTENVYNTPHAEDGLCMIMEDYKSRMSGGSAMDDYRTGAFMIVGTVSGDGNYTSVEALKSQCMRVCQEIVAKCINDSENMQIGGHIPGFDPDSVRMEFTGPFASNQYGCMCLFTYRAAADVSHYDDLSEIFIEP